MYNRYVPKPDGTYARKRIYDNETEQSGEQSKPVSDSASHLLQDIIPMNLDSGDLLVILLLLLISGEENSGQINALLTLVIYLFL